LLCCEWREKLSRGKSARLVPRRGERFTSSSRCGLETDCEVLDPARYREPVQEGRDNTSPQREGPPDHQRPCKDRSKRHNERDSRAACIRVDRLPSVDEVLRSARRAIRYVHT